MATKREKAKAERKTVALTDGDINGAKPRDKTYTLFDGGGLYLEVNPNGSKVWRMMARLKGKMIKMSFGKYPAVSRQGARIKRLEAQELIAKGINPNEQKKRLREAEKAKTEHTFEKIARAWHAMRKTGWRDSTADYILRRLELNIFPVIGNIQINDITAQQIKLVLQDIEARGGGRNGKTDKSCRFSDIQICKHQRHSMRQSG